MLVAVLFILPPSGVWGAEGDDEEVLDKTPPITGHIVPYMSGNHYLSHIAQDVEVTLFPSDNMTGMIETKYRINFGLWQVYNGGTVLFRDEGNYTIDFYSVDESGNVEEFKSIRIGIDRTAPITSRLITSEGVNAEQTNYTSDVTIILSSVDELSGMIGYFPSAARIEYRLIGEEWIRYTSTIVLTTGIHKFEYRSVDAVGNIEEIHAVDISIVPDPPSTRRSVSFQLGNHNSKYTKEDAVGVTLTAIGNTYTEYRINSGEWRHMQV